METPINQINELPRKFEFAADISDIQNVKNLQTLQNHCRKVALEFLQTHKPIIYSNKSRAIRSQVYSSEAILICALSFLHRIPMILANQTVGVVNAKQYDFYVNTLLPEELKELADATNEVDCADALLDVIIVAMGALASLGLDPGRELFEVLLSNLSKIDQTTETLPVRADGKYGKGPDFWKPELATAFDVAYARTKAAIAGTMLTE